MTAFDAVDLNENDSTLASKHSFNGLLILVKTRDAEVTEFHESVLGLKADMPSTSLDVVGRGHVNAVELDSNLLSRAGDFEGVPFVDAVRILRPSGLNWAEEIRCS